MKQSDWENKCLQFDPFDGEFGSPNDVILKDSVVKARKTYQCSWCRHGIMPGEKYRIRVDKIDGSLMQWRYCIECCRLMAEDDFNGLEIRLGYQPER